MARRFSLAWVGLLLPALASAQGTRVEPSVGVNLSWTDNARLSSTDKQADWMLQVRPGVLVEERHGRLTGRMEYALDSVARTREGGSARNVNSLDATARLEAIKNFFFVDARASVQGDNLSVFAPRALDNLTGSDRRGEVRSFGLSPSLRGQLGGNVAYSLQLDWSTLSADRAGLGRSERVRGSGVVSGDFNAHWGGSLAVDSTLNRYPDRDDFRNDVLRGRVRYAFTPEATVFATVGREVYDSGVAAQASNSRSVRGGGVDVAFGPRTKFFAEQESRFFGRYHMARLSHRLPLVAGNVEYSRDVSSSNQQVFAAGPGNLLLTVFDLYATRYPDPVERLDKVFAFFRQSGLPPFLTRPFAFYAQQPFIDRSLRGNLAWLGARNTLGASFYRSQREALATGFSLVDDFALGRTIDTRGQALDWHLMMSPLASFSLTASQNKNRALDGTAELRTRALVAALQTPLSAKSQAFGSLRHNRGDGAQTSYRENAVLGGVRLNF